MSFGVNESFNRMLKSGVYLVDNVIDLSIRNINIVFLNKLELPKAILCKYRKYR